MERNGKNEREIEKKSAHGENVLETRFSVYSRSVAVD